MNRFIYSRIPDDKIITEKLVFDKSPARVDRIRTEPHKNVVTQWE